MEKLTWRNKNKGGGFFTVYPSHTFVSLKEIHEFLSMGEVEFVNRKDVEFGLLSVLRHMEEPGSNIDLLNRIVINGGLVEYANQLERKIH